MWRMGLLTPLLFREGAVWTNMLLTLSLPLSHRVLRSCAKNGQTDALGNESDAGYHLPTRTVACASIRFRLAILSSRNERDSIPADSSDELDGLQCSLFFKERQERWKGRLEQSLSALNALVAAREL